MAMRCLDTYLAPTLRQADPERAPRPRMRATYDRTIGTRHLFAGSGLGERRASMICRYIIWRNNLAYDKRLRRIANRTNVD